MQRHHPARRGSPGTLNDAASQRLQTLWSIVMTTTMPTEEGDEDSLNQMTGCGHRSPATRRRCR